MAAIVDAAPRLDPSIFMTTQSKLTALKRR
jgi:hypothetical protein